MSKFKTFLKRVGRSLRGNLGKIGVAVALGGGFIATVEHDLNSRDTTVTIKQEAPVSVGTAQ